MGISDILVSCSRLVERDGLGVVGVPGFQSDRGMSIKQKGAGGPKYNPICPHKLVCCLGT